MSLGSGFLENIPHFTFTPTEHQVECVRVAGSRNLSFVLTQSQEKSFLVLMLVREVAQCVRSGAGKAALLLHDSNQVSLWTSFLTRMTDLVVSGLEECWEHDTAQRSLPAPLPSVVRSSHSPESDCELRRNNKHDDQMIQAL